MPKGQTLKKTETKTVTLIITREATEMIGEDGTYKYSDMDINVDIPGVGTALFSVTTGPAVLDHGQVVLTEDEPFTQFWGMTPAEVLEL